MLMNCVDITLLVCIVLVSMVYLLVMGMTYCSADLIPKSSLKIPMATNLRAPAGGNNSNSLRQNNETHVRDFYTDIYSCIVIAYHMKLIGFLPCRVIHLVFPAMAGKSEVVCNV